MERDSKEFYQNAASKVGDEGAKNFLLELATWEEQHKKPSKNVMNCY
jgi:rubrerythrin